MSPTKTKVQSIVPLNEMGEKVIAKQSRDFQFRLVDEIGVEDNLKIGVADYELMEEKSITDIEQEFAKELEDLDVLIVTRAFMKGAYRDTGSYSFIDYGNIDKLLCRDVYGVERVKTVLQRCPYNYRMNDGADYRMWYHNDKFSKNAEGIGTNIAIGWYGRKILFMPWYVSDNHRKDLHEAPMKNLIREGINKAIACDPAKWEEEAEIALGETIMKTMKARTGSKLKELDDEISTTIQNRSDWQAKVDACERKLEELGPQYEAVRAIVDAKQMITEENVLDVIREIKALPHVVSVTGSTTGEAALVIRTDELNMRTKFNGQMWETEVGAFEITLNFDRVRMTAVNLTRKQGNYDHPHITGGHWCLARMENMTNELIKTGDFATCVSFAIDQLQVVTAGGGYHETWRQFYADAGWKFNIDEGKVTYLPNHPDYDPKNPEKEADNAPNVKKETANA